MVAAEASELDGLWSRYEGMSEGDPVRFWYFHGDGHGLYRYGKVGYTNTNSFDYTVDGDQVEIRFRKTGQRHKVTAEIRELDGKRTLKFDTDPRDPGAVYTWARPPISQEAESAPAGDEPHPAGLDEPHPGPPFAERMWIDFQPFATGGAGFAMYQFGPAAIDGRGVGWFHEGDFDDWRTEALSYRVDGQRVELFFDLNQELGITPFLLREDTNKRSLILTEDPRDFWLTHQYKDAGRAFAEPALTPFVLGASLEASARSPR